MLKRDIDTSCIATPFLPSLKSTDLTHSQQHYKPLKSRFRIKSVTSNYGTCCGYYSVTILDRTHRFDECVLWWGSKNKNREDTCVKRDWITFSDFIDCSTLNGEHNWEDPPTYSLIDQDALPIITTKSGEVRTSTQLLLLLHRNTSFVVLKSMGRSWRTWKNEPNLTHISYNIDVNPISNALCIMCRFIGAQLLTGCLGWDCSQVRCQSDCSLPSFCEKVITTEIVSFQITTCLDA